MVGEFICGDFLVVAILQLEPDSYFRLKIAILPNACREDHRGILDKGRPEILRVFSRKLEGSENPLELEVAKNAIAGNFELCGGDFFFGRGGGANAAAHNFDEQKLTVNVCNKKRQRTGRTPRRFARHATGQISAKSWR